MENPTIVALTDRNDLDDQLFDTFSFCKDLLRQTPVQAESREHLRELLNVASGGVVFTTIQKFFPDEKGGKHPLLSDRRNIVVIADEAHRSQYDFIDGFARHIRDALPKASFIGFTGTPIESGDKNTQAVFGDYIDVYDILQAKEDHATVPIYYEARLAKIDLKPEERPKIDPNFEEGASRTGIGRRGGSHQGKPAAEVGAVGSDGGHGQADRARGGGFGEALGGAVCRDGRQGNGGLHEPPHLRGALQGHSETAPGLASR
jgi:type I restriction enzyme R subunit